MVIRGYTVPVVPVSLAATLVVAVPADVAPWLEPVLHPLGDPATGVAAADGAQVALVLLRLAPSGGDVLSPCASSNWTDDGRWPAASNLDALPCPETVQAPAGGLALREGALSPTDLAASPIEVNDAFAGALFDGPWAEYEHLVYPPAEPESEGAGHGGSQLPFVPPPPPRRPAPGRRQGGPSARLPPLGRPLPRRSGWPTCTRS